MHGFELELAGFLGVGRGVGFGVPFGVAFGVGAGVDRGVDNMLGEGKGVGISSSPVIGSGLAWPCGGSSSEGVGAAISGDTALAVEASALGTPALSSIQTTSVTAGFFALPLHRARPKRAAA